MKKRFIGFVIVLAMLLPAAGVFSQSMDAPPAKEGQGMMGGMQGGGMMCPMMGMGGMGMMGGMGGTAGDPKIMGRMLEMHGEMMMKMGEVMMKHAKQMQKGPAK
ncbi:MAG: hypothetical protein ACREP8_14250 [Candidatus Binatia bacterium]